MEQAIALLIWLAVFGLPTAFVTTHEAQINDAWAIIRGCGLRSWWRTVRLNRRIKRHIANATHDGRRIRRTVDGIVGQGGSE